MGSSPSLAQAQCPVEPVKQAQIPIDCKCGSPKVKWRCENCASMMCDMCKDKTHAAIGHHVIDITTIQVKISDVKEYQTKLFIHRHLAVSYDNSLWIGDGMCIYGEFHPFTSSTSLQKIKLVGNKAKVKASFNMVVYGLAVTSTNDILLATKGSRLMQIKAGSNKVTDSVYFVDWFYKKTVHVTKDGRVIVGGFKVVVVMDTDGKHLTRYEKDKNNQQLFSELITSITSTMNGNIFAACDRKVVVFTNTDIISVYRIHPTVNDEKSMEFSFSHSSVVTTPLDHVIVAYCDNSTLYILNNTGHLLTTYNTMGIGISFPNHLAITTEGSCTVLYMTCYRSTSLYKMAITGY